MLGTVKIGKKEIGKGHRVFIVAEMSANHGGSLEGALRILREAKACGADAVKLQTYTADSLTLNSGKPDFKINDDSPWSQHQTLYDLFQKAAMPMHWHEPLFREAKNLELEIFSSPFDPKAVDLLEDLGSVAYKIASPEVTDVILLERVGRTGKPVIVSTGVAELTDIDFAVNTLRNAGCKDIILLKCSASYPAPPESIHLRTIPHMAEIFQCVTGLSDHTLGIGVPVAAVALGASMIEKHFVVDRENAIDGFFSLTPAEFKQMVDEVRKVELALGRVNYSLDDDVKKDFRGRRSLYVSSTIQPGDPISHENVRAVRPAFGMPARYLKKVIGKKALRSMDLGDRLTFGDLDWSE